MEEMTLATELIKEVRQSAKRWFVAFCVMVVLEILTIGGFLWYISLPVEVESIEVEGDDGITSYVGNDMEGDFNYGQDHSD